MSASTSSTPRTSTARADPRRCSATHSVRFIGVSNWSGGQIRGVVELAPERGFAKIVSSQPEYSLLRRDPEEDVIPASRENGVSQIVYSPLAQGVLSGNAAASGVDLAAETLSAIDAALRSA